VHRLAEGFSVFATLVFVASILVAGLLLHPDVARAKSGEEIFQSGCNACHTIGGGRLVGPDLLGASDRRSEEWLVEFVQHSQAMVEAGDPVAVGLFEEHNKVTMPDQVLTKAEILAVMEYAKTPHVIGAAPPDEPVALTEEDIVLGQNLFEGSVRLSNGGPACNSCHDVTNDAVIGGGILAKELTTVFSRLGGPGVRAILGSPPFPVMQEAYEGEPLTEPEVKALVGFLEQADSEKALHQPRDYGIGLFTSGVVGSGILLGFYSLLWRRRKRSSVNQSIYDRQVKST
jgi:mono/diheme cytochrome c family protein